MKPIDLRLKWDPDERVSSQASGFVMMGSDVIELLTLVRTRPALAHGDVYVLPSSITNLDATGIVWIAKPPATVQIPLGAIPIKSLGASLWIPIGSCIAPSLTPELLRQTIGNDALTRVWIADVGLVGFSSDDRVGVNDWLDAPVLNASGTWTSPPTSPTVASRMIELSMTSPPALDHWLADMKDEIGAPPQRLTETSASGEGIDDESTSSKLKRWLLEKLDAAVQKSAASQSKGEQDQSLSKNGARSSGLHGMAAKITAPMAAAMSRMMHQQREKQIEKLLQMLKTDPDRALKYAIPLGGMAEAFRGFAIPGSALLSRLTDFSLGGIGGGAGSPLDAWSISNRIQLQLQQKYREQANRELAAGRYRRAAYVFAHLLDDYRGAAEALRKGKFFGEAGVLFRDRLNDSRKAAECFREGSMHRDARDLYIGLNDFESAGDVMADAGLPEEATELFERAVDHHMESGAVLTAATIMESRLNRRADAIELLCNQWPKGRETLRSMTTAIQWMAQDGDHNRTRRLLDWMKSTAEPSNLDTFVAVTSQAARVYPDHTVREVAEDHCRVGVSRAIRSARLTMKDGAIRVLGGLDENDRQLRRDALKFISSGIASIAPSEPSSSPSSRSWTMLTPLHLPNDARYVDFRMQQKQLFALAVRSNEIYLLHAPNLSSRGSFNLTETATIVDCEMSSRDDAMIMSIRMDLPGQIRVSALVSTDQAYVLRLSSGNAVPPPKLIIRPMKSIVAADDDGNIKWEIEKEAGNCVLRSSDGQTFDLNQAYEDAWGSQLAMDYEGKLPCESFAICIVEGVPVIALDRFVFRLVKGEIEHLASLDGVVVRLAASMKQTRRRVAIAHEAGLAVVYLDNCSIIHASKDQGFLDGMWTYGAKLVGMNRHGLYCFESRPGVLQQIAFHNWRHNDPSSSSDTSPTALLRLDGTAVGVAYESGRISRFLLPK